MKLADWVDEVKATGGVPDGDQDTLAAITSAAALCWAEIDRKRKRSSNGWRVFCASDSTRVLNCSHESSRLMKRAALSGAIAAGLAAAGASVLTGLGLRAALRSSIVSSATGSPRFQRGGRMPFCGSRRQKASMTLT